MVDRYTTIVYYITRAKHKRAHNLIHAIVAQLVTRDLAKVETAGSSPVYRSYNIKEISFMDISFSLQECSEASHPRCRTIYQYNRFIWYRQTFLKKFKITVDRCSTIVYYITRARHKRAHKHNKCDSGVVGNARPCQGRDRGFEPRLSLL